MRAYRLLVYDGPDDRIKDVLSRSIPDNTVRDYGNCCIVALDCGETSFSPLLTEQAAFLLAGGSAVVHEDEYVLSGEDAKAFIAAATGREP